ncbi:MAG: hypothetical protein AAF642_00740 [Pseudomonadota bacterium]
MSDTVPNAFLVLLGQIGLFVVALIYGLPLAFFTGALSVETVSFDTWVFLVSISIASFMMVANIMIGWSAVRNARNDNPDYPTKLFVVDLLVIFVLFGMNNIIIYALGAGFSAFDPSVISKIVEDGVDQKKSAYTLCILISMTSVYLFLCKIWNKRYYIYKNLGANSRYEADLTIVIIVQLILAVTVILFHANAALTLSSALIWGGSWIYINRGWVSSEKSGGTNTLPRCTSQSVRP